ncbi:uncharacterized protein SPPG_08721 [Spizellomyces punctatus DAOM BR117]|uniref:Uncharacterized protein n=1 Tax=Spizellomyces punctatus (strain DAOM BR117) TaxID=645134 RepID=A0A0L0H4L6_SPIPD|nr:uncharacterized protein SPPG_08721 [Spizellomyces punctatus DAOM BR117]KNC95856.1 hypothetical protein SPPG_08721 [Spizellomyces punctatus DAOM BR117]|eukprot:XP_016603896.1 hypothetical protein SPPG_08721 [Spizellomyces punctatus DAOM BR117]
MTPNVRPASPAAPSSDPAGAAGESRGTKRSQSDVDGETKKRKVTLRNGFVKISDKTRQELSVPNYWANTKLIDWSVLGFAGNCVASHDCVEWTLDNIKEEILHDITVLKGVLTLVKAVRILRAMEKKVRGETEDLAVRVFCNAVNKARYQEIAAAQFASKVSGVIGAKSIMYTEAAGIVCADLQPAGRPEIDEDSVNEDNDTANDHDQGTPRPNLNTFEPLNQHRSADMVCAPTEGHRADDLLAALVPEANLSSQPSLFQRLKDAFEQYKSQVADDFTVENICDVRRRSPFLLAGYVDEADYQELLDMEIKPMEDLLKPSIEAVVDKFFNQDFDAKNWRRRREKLLDVMDDDIDAKKMRHVLYEVTPAYFEAIFSDRNILLEKSYEEAPYALKFVHPLLRHIIRDFSSLQYEGGDVALISVRERKRREDQDGTGERADGVVYSSTGRELASVEISKPYPPQQKFVDDLGQLGRTSKDIINNMIVQNVLNDEHIPSDLKAYECQVYNHRLSLSYMKLVHSVYFKVEYDREALPRTAKDLPNLSKIVKMIFCWVQSMAQYSELCENQRTKSRRLSSLRNMRSAYELAENRPRSTRKKTYMVLNKF